MLEKGKAKTKKAAKMAGAALSGDAGILKTLEAEHAEVSSLMADVLDGDGDVDDRHKLYPEIRKKLLVHAKGEELEFYPVCREHPETQELTRESLDDHKELERLIAELDRMDIASPGWLTTFERLQASVEEHVEMEENEMFPRAKQALGSDRLRAMNDAYKERKPSLMERVEQLDPRMTEAHAPMGH